MSTKMKGLFKGLRYISQIFDEEQQKEQDMQIGLPTDVKHVAHVGWDGAPTSASSADSPNWMKDLGPSTPGMAAPFGDSKPGQNNPDIKWVSEDSKRGQRTKKSQEKEQQGDGPKPSRRRSTDNNTLDTSPKKEKPSRRLSADNKPSGDTVKPRQPRRSHPKDSSDSAAKESGISDVAKKTRRKKSETNDQTSSRRPRNKVATNGGDSTTESGDDGGGAVRKRGSRSCTASEDEEEREDRGRVAQMKEPLQN